MTTVKVGHAPVSKNLKRTYQKPTLNMCKISKVKNAHATRQSIKQNILLVNNYLMACDTRIMITLDILYL